jgi:hypothetical protein
MYYVIQISTGDAKIAGKSIYEYDTEKTAVAAFHKKLGTAMDSELYTSSIVMVIDESGFPIQSECYRAEAE